MKKLIKQMTDIETSERTKLNEAATISISAETGAEISDMIAAMQGNAGMQDTPAASAPSLGMRGDMEKFRTAMIDDPDIPGKDDVEGDKDLKAGTLGALGGGALGMALGGPLGALTGAAAGDSLTDEELATEDDLEEYANEPDPQYGDTSDAIPDGNDLNRKKKAYPATQDGDNPMAVETVKQRLMAALSEKKKPDANKNGIPDYAEDGKGPNDLAKGKKGSKPKKGVVPPQFQKKGTDEGGQTKDCPKCGAPGKKKLMACSSCGCS